MDLSEPARALASGLTVPVLRALSRRTTPATASQLWRAARTGTLAGIQRACDRLVEHGLVETEEAGGRVVYSLNYDHLLYDAVEAILAADGALRRRMSDAIETWTIQPVSAVLFGSAARLDGDTDSDIDLLLVRPAVRASQRAAWGRQVHDLTRDVRRWTGNRLHVLDLARPNLRRLAAAGDPVFTSWVREGVTLAGDDVDDVIGAA